MSEGEKIIPIKWANNNTDTNKKNTHMNNTNINILILKPAF